ncbi:efflux RND transporter periplasmic adaptor subunit [Microvirga pudoricolor]|uniref:efflux RND transporter periplasmic adaptor subunit n=1 Tax=Microvirga pudoricolor TaxID=2778729 RepID=UPI001951797B|nr:efflux RND transporter periplasmic adaptor subunit [Microvirga pudoricolor]MBM6594816.1 efflux RND transporter periplasmic adaptor subunit [Microvirga pudoricolor]
MKRRIVVSLVFILAVGLCAGLVWFNFFKDRMIKDFFANMQQPAQAVTSAKVEAKTWNPGIAAVGTARAANGVDLAVETAGVVKAINFKPNQQVKQGDVLIQLDDSVERAELQDVTANVKLAESAFERAKTLTNRGYGTEASYDEVVARLATARSRQARLEATINQKNLKAPFSGVVGISLIDIGQYLTPGTKVATFQDLSSMKVDFSVPELQAELIKLGQAVRVGISESNLPLTGKIIGKNPRVDPATRLVSMQAVIEDNKDNAITPGQFLHVRVIMPEEPNIVTVPQTAVITSLYGDYVYTIEQDEKDGKTRDVVRQVFVKSGRREGPNIEIKSGINPGQTVVASGQNKLQAGAAVKINNSIDLTKLGITKMANGQ